VVKNQNDVYLLAQGCKRKSPVKEVVQITLRVCLKCRNNFQSLHKSNRICNVCAVSNLRVGKRVDKGGSRGKKIGYMNEHAN